MFKCPQCQAELVRNDGEGGVFWACPKCAGSMITMPILRRIVDKDALNGIWNASWKQSADGRRACPSCRRAMANVPAMAEPATPPLDVCRRCQVIWFDTMELESVPPAPEVESAEDAIKSMPMKAREALAMRRLEDLRRKQEAESGDSYPGRWWQWLPAALGMPVETGGVRGAGRTPWATWSTAALIFVVGVLGILGGQEAIEEYGLRPNSILRHGGVTLITSFLLHAGWFHLLGNLYFLLTFGDNVEEFLGWGKWLALLILAALVGDALHIMMDPRGDLVLVGASGGISGLLAFYALRFPMARVGMFFRISYSFRWVEMPVWAMFCFWIVFQFIGAYLQHEGLSNVSSLAHLGGAVVGLAFWLLFRKHA